MSYCRWSSDDFACDVYVYHCVDGTWTTHVAASRYVGDIPKLIPLAAGNEVAWGEAYRRQHDYIRSAGSAAIGLAHDGATFRDADPASCAATLGMLRDAGYHVPDYAIAELLDEASTGGVES